MLDLFAIFSKGGIVLWCFQSTKDFFAPSVNALIRSSILQERSGNKTFEHASLLLQYKLDNEFELVFVVAYQKILQLSYIDKFLDDIHLEFRDKFQNDLQQGRYFQQFSFDREFQDVLHAAEKWSMQAARIPKQMRSYDESAKSKKTVASMIERKDEKKENKKIEKKYNKKNGVGGFGAKCNGDIGDHKIEVPVIKPTIEELNNETIMQNRQKMAQRMAGNSAGKKTTPKADKHKSPKNNAGKKPRVWDLAGSNRDVASLEYTRDKPSGEGDVGQEREIVLDESMVGSMSGHIHDLEVASEDEFSDEEDVQPELPRKQTTKASRGMFAMFKGLVGSKSLNKEDVQPALEKLRDHLIAKNVASDVAATLCDSVASQLEGKVLGTFSSVASTVRSTLNESLVQILSPKRRLDILRDALESKRQARPYVMAFCGVNGVGKSTNLAKICFWLIENDLRVLIAACDTFRAGAVEQLRTHTRHLNALHPPEKHQGKQMVQLYEKGYGKDAAGIAMEAINYARDSRIDVVLVDTAGRMQDNEPLMRALAKLIKVNEPDLVLFVGEALVGNEAVDQLVKFNQALADHSSSTQPHLIDGIVLTKFDTIDDKVGAAISMTYITGQPIVFVGTGQTYTDLKSLNAKAVVHALMK